MHKKVSIIIPIYNVEQYLEKCLNSVIHQTYKNLEIICVNDCSPDNSQKIIERYKKLDSRIIICNRTNNGGLSTARNTGLKIATGEFIYFLDSDDWIDLDYIEKMLHAAIESQAEVVLNTNIQVHNKNLPPEQHFPDRTYNNITHKFIDAKPAILNIIWNTCAHLWKKTFLDRINAHFPDGYIIEDQYFQAITYAYLDKIYVIRDSTYHYLIRKTSITGTLKTDSFSANLNILNKIYDFYIKNNLFDKIDVRMITEWILPQYDENRAYQIKKVRLYFLKIAPMVNRTRNMYNKFELKLFDDIVNNNPCALTLNYFNLYVIDKLREKMKQNKGVAIHG